MMKKRNFLALATAALLVPQMAWAEEGILEYTPGLIEQKLAAGNIVMVDFFENYCSTCRAQARALTALREENPAYDAKIVFINVNIQANEDLAAKHQVTRHGTLLMLFGDEVLARVDSITKKEKIKVFLDAGLI
jgi:thioredoxin 1